MPTVNGVDQRSIMTSGVDIPPSSPTIYDDEFPAGSSLDPRWTWVNQGSATAVISAAESGLLMTIPLSPTFVMRGIEQDVNGSTWEYTTKITPLLPYGTGIFCSCGLWLRDSVGGKIEEFSVFSSNGTATNLMSEQNTNTTTSTSNTNIMSGVYPVWAQTIYLRAKYDGTNYLFSAGFSGRADEFNRNIAFTRGKTTFLASVANKVGLAIGTGGSTLPIGMFVHWFRKTA